MTDLDLKRTTVTTSLGDIAAMEVGEGPVLLMLHGGGPGASSLGNYAHNLPGFAKNFRVLLLDQPGFGGSYRPTKADLADRSITEITVDALYQALDQLGVDSFHLLGNSLGGAAALAMTLAQPQRVTRLVLMAPGGGWLSFGPTPTEGQKMMFRYYNGEGPTVKKMKAFISTMVANPKNFSDQDIQQRYEGSLDPSHVEFYHHYNAAFAARHGMDPLWRDVHKIACPTFLLWGQDDRTITLDGAQVMLKQIRDVQLHVFSQCGHWVQLEKQKEFERLVTDFLLDA